MTKDEILEEVFDKTVAAMCDDRLTINEHLATSLAVAGHMCSTYLECAEDTCDFFYNLFDMQRKLYKLLENVNSHSREIVQEGFMFGENK